MVLESFAGFNGDMLRCQSCDGILTKNEKVCYLCGDAVPERAKAQIRFFPLLVALGVILSLGFTAYTFLWDAAR